MMIDQTATATPDTLPATAKVLRILELVVRAQGASAAELARGTGMPKSTVLRLLATLVTEGFLDQSPSKEYVPAIKLWELGALAIRWDDTHEVISTALRSLVEKTDETAHHAVYDGGRSVYIMKIDGTQAVRAYTRVGEGSPAYATATGKVLLAWQPEAEIRKVLSTAQSFTPSTITTTAEFLEIADTIRHDGFAVNRGEWRSDVWGVAAPLRDMNDTIVGAVGLSGPSERMQRSIEQYTAQVVEAARDVSRRLGSRHDVEERQ